MRSVLSHRHHISQLNWINNEWSSVSKFDQSILCSILCFIYYQDYCDIYSFFSLIDWMFVSKCQIWIEKVLKILKYQSIEITEIHISVDRWMLLFRWHQNKLMVMERKILTFLLGRKKFDSESINIHSFSHCVRVSLISIHTKKYAVHSQNLRYKFNWNVVYFECVFVMCVCFAFRTIQITF